MTTPARRLGQLCEDALHGMLSRSVGGNIYRTADRTAAGEKVLYPHVAVISQTVAVEFPDAPATNQASGNRIVTVNVETKTTVKTEKSGGVVVATARDQHANLAGAVDDALVIDDLETQLNAQSVAGLYVTFAELGDASESVEDGRYVTTQPVMVHCCAVR